MKIGTTSVILSAFGNSLCSTQQLNKLLIYDERIRVLYLRNLMLISFSLTDFFAFKERITVVTSSGVVGVKKKKFIVVTSLLLNKCSVTERMSELDW